MLYPCRLAGELFLNIKLLLFCLIVLVALMSLLLLRRGRGFLVQKLLLELLILHLSELICVWSIRFMNELSDSDPPIDAPW